MAIKRVVITGYGALCALGENSPDIWAAVMNYQAGYKRVDLSDAGIKAKFFGFLPINKTRYVGFPKTILKTLPVHAKYALVAAREALTMAFGSADQLSEHIASPFDIGVVIGTGWGGSDALNKNNNDYRECGIASTFGTVMSMASAASAAVSMNWNLRGYQNTTVAACASGSIAIGDAYEVIKSGRATVVLAGGSESIVEQYNVWSIDVIQALSKEQNDVRLACCPFSAGRSGFVLSEGAAILCLEEMQHALARGATILGEITGYANYSDATDMTAPAPDLKARQMSIVRAMRDAGRHPGELDYINLHGTSTPMNDSNESDALKLALGDAAYSIPMSSTKSYTGHMIGAAGAIEALFCLKAIATGTIPATIHLDQPAPECDLNYTPNEHVRNQAITAAMSLSFGFGGANACLIIEKFQH